MNPGARFRKAVATAEPLLQCVGVTNAYHALLAEHAGFQSLYLSGSGVAAASCGLPDLGVTTLDDVLIDIRRITAVTDLPVLVDIDTGWGGPLNIARAIHSIERAGAAAIHIEDQQAEKRCGHRPGKAIVPTVEMVGRINAAVDARRQSEFVIMARTDALAVEGMSAAIDRAVAYVAAGADMLFPEAMLELDQYRSFVTAVDVPVLANITEFGQTPLFTAAQLAEVGVRIALYPLSAFRASSKAAFSVYQSIGREGTQASVIDSMQTREELYSHLSYHAFEQQIDRLLESQDPEPHD